MNIAVLAGGISTERDVSLSSATGIAKALKKMGHNVALVDSFMGRETIPENILDVFLKEIPENSGVGTKQPNIAQLKAQRGESGFGELGKNVIEICKAADLVYMGLHGENGENGRMQALLDVLNIKYTGSGYLGSALAMNKWTTKEILLQNVIVTPKAKRFTKGGDLSECDCYGFPCIVKVCSGGSSIGVSIANSKEELDKAINTAFEYEDELIVEEHIEGREFSVGILGGKVLPPIEIIPQNGWYDYEHKYQAGQTLEVCPADITPQQEEALKFAAKEVYDALNLQVYARVDFIMDKNNVCWCLEANTLPGMTPTSLIPQEAAVEGMSYEDVCSTVIEYSLKKYDK